jgi:hypothetical protein
MFKVKPVNATDQAMAFGVRVRQARLTVSRFRMIMASNSLGRPLRVV